MVKCRLSLIIYTQTAAAFHDCSLVNAELQPSRPLVLEHSFKFLPTPDMSMSRELKTEE
jgi:hypothetical protein